MTLNPRLKQPLPRAEVRRAGWAGGSALQTPPEPLPCLFAFLLPTPGLGTHCFLFLELAVLELASSGGNFGVLSPSAWASTVLSLSANRPAPPVTVQPAPQPLRARPPLRTAVSLHWEEELGRRSGENSEPGAGRAWSKPLLQATSPAQAHWAAPVQPRLQGLRATGRATPEAPRGTGPGVFLSTESAPPESDWPLRGVHSGSSQQGNEGTPSTLTSSTELVQAPQAGCSQGSHGYARTARSAASEPGTQPPNTQAEDVAAESRKPPKSGGKREPGAQITLGLRFRTCRGRLRPPARFPQGTEPAAGRVGPLPGAPLTPHRLVHQPFPVLLLLLWPPTSLALHSPPLRPGARTHAAGTPRCYSAAELPLGHDPPHLLARAAKWEQALPVALVSSLEAAGRRGRHAGLPAGNQCPVLQPEEVLEADVHQRSISPWRYRVDTDESRYPQKLAFAECLCRGCISTRTGRETAALNSVPLVRSLLVLRRRPCSRDAAGAPTPGAFTFHTEFIRVPVGCTCVLPRSSR
ncbi:LOW QUALITY PROTEIN: interleukin-17C [Mesoplodon densirostris]|uniref:LOW QUALITY PROTEIN: interleukin-17C n=1 Tax=Mesoplodon densirostris TaxID=48708 RepID=UPI0028DB3614|nr:LOW QUALITY PROTEIN: interleukin-17C [Mesoplodon densirostris]